jgi:hypothetical protein
MYFYSPDMFRQGRVDGGITPEVVTTIDLSNQGFHIAKTGLSSYQPTES